MTKRQEKYITGDPFYDLNELTVASIRTEVRDFLVDRSQKVNIVTFCAERVRYRKICLFLNRYAQNVESLADIEKEVWMKKLKAWMLREGIEITKKREGVYGTATFPKTREFGYLDAILDFVNERRMMQNGVAEKEKDIWHLEKLDMPYKDNPVKNVKSIDFTAISQKSIREELKKGIYLNLQSEAIACVKKEMTAIRRLARKTTTNTILRGTESRYYRRISDLLENGRCWNEIFSCRVEPTPVYIGKDRSRL